MLFTRAVIPAGYEVLERLLGRQAEGMAVAPLPPHPVETTPAPAQVVKA
jgi:hypothetical protein